MLRITLDQRGKLFFWSLTERGEQHESFRGYTTLLESCRASRPVPTTIGPCEVARAGKAKAPSRASIKISCAVVLSRAATALHGTSDVNGCAGFSMIIV